jgi:Domain of unknown function (DUF4404)
LGAKDFRDMDRDQIDDRLRHLLEELQSIETADDDQRRVLQHLKADIEELIEGTEGISQSGYDQLVGRLREGIEHFEASHPGVTLVMGQLADALAKMGI